MIMYGAPGGSIHTEEGFAYARNCGVNGICSDRPTLLKEWLKKNRLKAVDEKTK